MPCLDTNFLIGLIRGNKEAKEKISSIEGKTTIKTTSINACELYKGAKKSDRAKENNELITSMLGNIQMLNFDIESAKVEADIMENLRKKGESLSAMDILIASIAIANNETLITRDQHFKRIKGLRIETW